MCGIAGVISPKIAKKEEIIGQMVKAIQHRGPDDDGFYVDKHVGLGMRRLSIIDLETGRQPITTSDETKLIFFNGEIYNYRELREDLVNRNYEFKTHTDTEVILHMYEEFGPEMLTKLRGMFTFCIYDTEKKTVFLARDFFGIKPLYYLVQNERVVAFSSEIKSFLSFPQFEARVNDDAVFNYFLFQYNPLPETFFKDVYKLPPSHFMTINVESGETEIKKYWSFNFKQEKSFIEKQVSKTVFDTVVDSVHHHMIADVPVGAFLSGGIDSSIITTTMQSIRRHGRTDNIDLGESVKTFTVGFNTLTEGLEAKETSSPLKTDHTEITIGPDEYFEALPNVVYHFDEPVADPSAVGLYFLAREARKKVKVVLSGEGADELFGGYNIYLVPQASAKFSWLPKFLLDIPLSLPFEFFGKNYLRRVNMKLEEWYFGQKYFNESVFQKKEIESIFKNKKTDFISLNQLYKQASSLTNSTKMQHVDIHTWLVGDILAKADKMTMAHSLELRVPFLDMKVAELAKRIPDNLKWRNGKTKYILREAFKNFIPETTRNRRKLGFPTPVKDWFTGDREDLYQKILQNEYIATHMDTRIVEKIIRDHTSKKTDNSRKIYTLLLFALWYDKFITS